MLAIGVAWPTLHERSYRRWRTAAVGSARLLLMALPANFDVALFDAMTPALATGRFAGLINLSTILLGALAPQAAAPLQRGGGPAGPVQAPVHRMPLTVQPQVC